MPRHHPKGKEVVALLVLVPASSSDPTRNMKNQDRLYQARSFARRMQLEHWKREKSQSRCGAGTVGRCKGSPGPHELVVFLSRDVADELDVIGRQTWQLRGVKWQKDCKTPGGSLCELPGKGMNV